MEEDIATRTKYTISLEDFEFASLPIQFGRRDRIRPLRRSTNEEYYEIEIHEASDKAKSDQDLYENEMKTTCHICDIEIPKAYLYEHNSGWKHQTFLKIAKNAMERVKKHIFQNDHQSVQPKDYSTYYCDTCALTIKVEHKENHERSKEHYLSKTHDALLENMLLLFAERDAKTQNSKAEIPIHSVNESRTIHNIDESTDDEDDANVSNPKNVFKKATQVSSRVAVDVPTNGFTQSSAKPKFKNTSNTSNQDKYTTAKKETVEMKTNISMDALPKNILSQFNKEKPNTKDTLNISNQDKLYSTAKKETVQMKTNVSDSSLTTVITQNHKPLPKRNDQNPEQVIDSNEQVKSNKEVGWELIEEYHNKLGLKIHSSYNGTNFVYIITMNGARVKVHKDNYHGFGKIDGQMYCKICSVVINEGKAVHRYAKQHVMKLMEPLQDGHWIIRKIDDNLYHCVICNLTVKDVQNHITSDYVHLSEIKRINKDQPIQHLKEETESLPQQTQTISASALNQVTQSSQPTLNRWIQPLVNLNSVPTIKPNVSMKPNQNLPASVVNLPKLHNEPSQSSNQKIDQEETCVRIVSDEELFCIVCNRRMLIEDFQNHADGQSHKKKLEKLNTTNHGHEPYESKIPEKPVAEEYHYHFCQVCQVKVPPAPNCIQVHEEGKPHMKKLGKLNNMEGPSKNLEVPKTSYVYSHLLSGNSEWMDLNANPREGTCRICKVIIPNKEANVREHLRGAAHTANLKKMLG